jgi:hypothetical protein
MHGGPQVVGLEAEQQFEDAAIGLRADVLVRLLGTVGPRGEVLLVVDEDAPVADGRLVPFQGSRGDRHGVAVLHGDVGPPVPGRDPDAFRGVVDAVGGAAPVASGDHQGAFHSADRAVHHLGHRRLPAALHPGDVQPPFPDEPVDDRARADGAHQDEQRGLLGQVVPQPGLYAADPLDVRPQIAGRADHRGVVRRVHEQVDGHAAPHQGEAGPVRRRGPGGRGQHAGDQRGRPGGRHAPQERLAGPCG